MILHSDQGAVYASKAFNELLPMYSITRSMSRAGTPTDNAAMESINGWIKAEIFMDFHVTGESPVEQEAAAYITFFNTARPAYSLKYLTPQQYKEAYAPKDFAIGVSAGGDAWRHRLFLVWLRCWDIRYGGIVKPEAA